MKFLEKKENQEMKNSIIREAISTEEKYLKRKMEEFKTLKKVARSFNEEKFPEGTKMWMDAYMVYITIPWGVRNMRLARVAVGQGWKFAYKSNQMDGSINYVYSGYFQSGKLDKYDQPETTYLSLTISMSANELVEDSCQKVLVSEETKTYVQKTYKVVCADGSMKTLVES